MTAKAAKKEGIVATDMRPISLVSMNSKYDTSFNNETESVPFSTSLDTASAK